MPSGQSVILVSGATGNIGVELVSLLARDPQVGQIRAGTRDPESAKARLVEAMAPNKIRAVQFSTDAADFEAAFEGVDVLCLITPLIHDMVGWQRDVLAAATKVRRIVKVSVDAARPQSEGSEPGTPPGDHWEGEEMVRAMDIERAIVRPTLFMQHFMIVPGLYEQGDDSFYLPIADAHCHA